MCRPKNNAVLIIALSGLFWGSISPGAAENDFSSLEGKKRDPFVALLKTDGKIKTWEELFPSVKKAPAAVINVQLTAIIWDEARPLAFINGKVYPQGKEISKGIILKKINQNSVEISDGENVTTVVLRETQKKAGQWIK